MRALIRFLDYFRLRKGMALAMSALVMVLITVVPSFFGKKPSVAKSSPIPPADSATNRSITIFRPTIPVQPIPLKSEAIALTNKRPVHFSVHVDLPADTNEVRQDLVPFGRQLRCQLVNTLESLVPNTPVIALLTAPLYFKGDIVIPSGTEIHGQAQFDRVRERIMASGSWVLVLPGGKQMRLTGMALDREFEESGAGWGITDGSAGIRGDILRNSTIEEVKLFLTSALSAFGRSLQQTQTTPFGSFVPNSLRNAGLAGSSAALDAYAQRIADSIQREGIYVRVPAGKQFYLYVTETIDFHKPSLASITIPVSNAPPRTASVAGQTINP